MLPSAFNLIVAALLWGGFSFGISTLQSFWGARIGTDHPGHAFLIRGIRANNYRLFERVPRLLNDAVCAALPLYLHWIFARFPDRAMFWAERLLNPTMNALQVWMFAGLAWLAYVNDTLSIEAAILATGCFALTPQFSHALSARNFGLSSRSIGLLLFTAFFAAVHWVGTAPVEPLPWLALATAAYLLFGFNTFGAQALVIVSLTQLPISGRFVPIAGVALGLLIFVAVHPRYSLAYLRHTLRFIHAFATELAPIFILSRRHSIWRDLVWDIWRATLRSPVQGLRYAYENSVVVVAVLNPFLLLASVGWTLGWVTPVGLAGLAADIALAGAVAMLLTSFRATRFLGEPERYAEIVTPWSTLVGATLLYAWRESNVLLIVAGLFLCLTLIQLAASRILMNYISAKPIDIGEAQRAILAIGHEQVRLASNNEHLTKQFMLNDWDFSYCIAVGRGYCGMTISEAFSRFPCLRAAAFEKILETYRINIAILDLSLGDSVFGHPPPALAGTRTIYESEGIRAIALDWIESTAPLSDSRR